jgi:hypothetical protein
MRGWFGAVALGAAGVLSIAVLTATGASAHAATAHSSVSHNACASRLGGATHVGRFRGISRALPMRNQCQVHNTSDAANGTPPLIFHGGAVMGTASTGPVVLTPIYWRPAGHPIPSGYRSILNGYLRGVAAASGRHTNVFSTLNEYYGSNGDIQYQVRFATPISDTNPLPPDGCRLTAHDRSGIYADDSGYNACLDDDQVQAEVDSVVTAGGLPQDLAHMYVMFLPKHVESCFSPGSTRSSSNQCTINYEPSAAYCAYHSQVASGTVYANMPFPVYTSPVGYTCGSDAIFPTVQTPNKNPDADTEVSPTSHEIMEAITDPDTTTGWFDSSGFENGDECAYVFGPTKGTAGQQYNQAIRGRHYLTQEEFSNRDYANTGLGCLQSE